MEGRKKVRGCGRLICTLLLTAAFLLPPGAEVTAWAAVTWEKDGGQFRCYDRDGDPISGSWVKDSGNYYYLDEDGLMAADQLIEEGGNTYYVGADGAMVKRQWVFVTSDLDYMNEWFYFNSSGRAYRDGKRKINGETYLFDENGCMLSGWQKWGADDALYYLGEEDEGYLHTGWQLLEPWDEMDGNYESEEWFYFQKASGKAYRNTRKQINGSSYYFDANGITKDKWISATPGSAATSGSAATPASPSGYVWADEVTKAAGKGWLYAYAPGDVHETGEQSWFYLDKKGVPFNLGAKDSSQNVENGWDSFQEMDGEDPGDIKTGAAARVIAKETYLFDGEGRMMTGVYYLQGIKCKGGSNLGFVPLNDSFFTGAFYYFDETEGASEGRMLTGKQTVEGEGGEQYHYYFSKNGQAYCQAIVGGSLYNSYGLRVDAKGRGYQLFYLPPPLLFIDVDTGRRYSDCEVIVNDSGRLKKSGTVTFGGFRYTVRDYEVVRRETAD